MQNSSKEQRWACLDEKRKTNIKHDENKGGNSASRTKCNVSSAVKNADVSKCYMGLDDQNEVSRCGGAGNVEGL